MGMAKIFYKKVVNDEISLEKVPKLWREQVRKMLEEEAQ